MRRIFYVVYVEGEVLGDCLDAIRVLAHPSEKCHSHVTVRGPYKKKINLRTINPKVLDIPMWIEQAGHFFHSNQNTVFLSCSAPGLRTLWKKLDFPTFNPHITLYDGPSREFAEELYTIVNQYSFGIRSRAKELAPFISIGGQSSFALRLMFNEKRISEIAGEHLSLSAMFELSRSRRLAIIDRICHQLAQMRGLGIDSFDRLSWQDWAEVKGNTVDSRVRT